MSRCCLVLFSPHRFEWPGCIYFRSAQWRDSVSFMERSKPDHCAALCQVQDANIVLRIRLLFTSGQDAPAGTPVYGREL